MNKKTRKGSSETIVMFLHLKRTGKKKGEKKKKNSLFWTKVMCWAAERSELCMRCPGLTKSLGSSQSQRRLPWSQEATLFYISCKQPSQAEPNQAGTHWGWNQCSIPPTCCLCFFYFSSFPAARLILLTIERKSELLTQRTAAAAALWESLPKSTRRTRPHTP